MIVRSADLKRTEQATIGIVWTLKATMLSTADDVGAPHVEPAEFIVYPPVT